MGNPHEQDNILHVYMRTSSSYEKQQFLHKETDLFFYVEYVPGMEMSV